ncbi:cathepsin O-like isoform X2 [Vespa velutina]|uniref:cathepsin O-like isoform X2 n=1 Tax=Vespa velutina TaxID=202808 RepID=UPI001FB2748F|nr:cathepsin O-like isoform X2 [Vespa velutina]
MEWRTVAVTILVVTLCFLAIPIRIGPDNNNEDIKLFENYVARYNKSYKNNPTEYSDRFERFQRSLRHIEKMNGFRSSQESAFYGLTEFSDMSEDEFLQKTLFSDLSERGKKHANASYHNEHRKRKERNHLKKRTIGIPLKVDWREKGIISPVKNQGSCGACWAFSTVEVVESMYAIKNGSLHVLSVQEMIDCARNTNLGCEGGDICSLLAWLKLTKSPILPESNYPLTRMTDTCKLKGFIDSEEELLITLATHGPVAAAVNALSWQNYLGGIIQYHCDGAFASLNHAVQIVGYDKSDTIPYYIIKNSWGPAFGDRGYIYIAIGNNLCGIANQVSALDIIYK